MRVVIFFLLFFICEKNSFAQSEPEIKNLSSIIKEFDTLSVLNSIIWLKDFKSLTPKLKIDEKIDPSLNTIMFDSLSQSEISSAIKITDKYIKTLNAGQRNGVLKKITYWCMGEKILSDLAYFDGNFSFREVIFYLPQTKRLIARYIADPELQDWNSLSSFQTNSLLYDVLNYVTALSEIDQLEFYKKYIAMAVQLSEKNK
jgi:hypothetical protein